MKMKKPILLMWMVTTVATFCVLVVYGAYIEYVDNLTKAASAKFFFVDLAVYTYPILTNVVIFLIYSKTWSIQK